MRRSSLVVALAVAATAFLSPVTSADAALAAPAIAPASPLKGEKFHVTGDIGDVPAPTALTLQSSVAGANVWKDVAGQTQQSADGSYDFTTSTTAASIDLRVHAATDPVDDTTPVNVKTATETATLRVLRIGTGNDAEARGAFTPARAGRLVQLQYLSGKTWKSVASSAKTAEDANGNVTIPFKIETTSKRSYRLLADPIDAAPAKASNTASFTRGPATLGPHVIQVVTDSGTTPTVKGKDYTGTAYLDGGAALDVETIAVRGNSSATKPKKPYKLKFEEKQKPYGLKSDKTWILLANYIDRSLVRSKAAWDLGAQLPGLKWTPSSQFAELYINGVYKGSYQLVQSIKIDSNRVKIDKVNGQVMEFDPHWKEDKVPGMVLRGLNYSWKDPDEFKTLLNGEEDPEGLTDAKIAAMKEKIKKFDSVLYARDWSKTDFATLPAADDWTTYLDMNSAVDYYLAREFTKDNDADMYRSNFFYTDNVNNGSLFFMGPIWDFDRSAGNFTGKEAGKTTSVASPTGWWMRGSGSPTHDTNKIHWYTRIAKDPRFLAAIEARWAEKKAAFAAVATTGVQSAVDQVTTTAANNDRAIWKGDTGRYKAHGTSYAGEISYLKSWYQKRYNWMDGQLTP